MPKGGARVNSGPPPDPNALRRERRGDQAGWTTLPAEGYAGPVPDWPLTARAAGDEAAVALVAERERSHWVAAWRTPQAVAWSRLGWSHEVALYCRHLALAELGDMKAASEARQWSDRLGLNPAAMLRNRWRVAALDQAAPASAGEKTGKAASAPRRRSSRSRLRLVDRGGQK